MERYEEYKDSGVVWIGEIPEYWEVKKFRFLFNLTKGLTITKADLKSNGVPCVSYGEIHSKYGFEVIPEEDELKCVDTNYLDLSQQSLLKRGDFVFADTSEDIEGSGNFTHLHSDTNVFAGYHTIIARLKNDINYRYVAYFFDSLVFRNQVRQEVKGVKVYSITNVILKNTFIILPPQDEQKNIANYLNKKTAEIDILISQKEQLLALYEEEKKGIINQAMTKGIDPDVKLKDSGVPWLGEIPEHWEVKRIGYSFKTIGSGTTPKTSESSYYHDGDVYWLNTGDLNNGYIDNTSKKITTKALKDISTLKIYPKNSLVIAMYGATIGKLGITKIETTVNQACCVLNDSDVLRNKYLFYWLILNKNHIINLASGGGQPNISQEVIRNLRVQTPSLKEQDSIVEYIEKKFEKNEIEKNRVIKLMTLLKEYRTALISEVVTGKVKVTEEM
ncbi:MAG: restriction endonuclease subunit S [Epsilonproteobacteria bacterium]|nr:restriction endonuclease subunit S [Campylobacterota bacterium]